MLEHADAVFDDEEEVDAGQRSEPLPHSIKLGSQISVATAAVLAVVVLSLRLQTTGYLYTNLVFVFSKITALTQQQANILGGNKDAKHSTERCFGFF